MNPRHHLRALLDQKFSEPHNLLHDLRRAHIPPRHPRRPADPLQSWLQGGLSAGIGGIARDSGFLPQGLDIDHLVAVSLAQGPRTSSVLRALFGIVPGLMGR